MVLLYYRMGSPFLQCWFDYGFFHLGWRRSGFEKKKLKILGLSFPKYPYFISYMNKKITEISFVSYSVKIAKKMKIEEGIRAKF